MQQGVCHALLRGQGGVRAEALWRAEGEKGLLFAQELSRHWGPCPGAAGEAAGQMESSRGREGSPGLRNQPLPSHPPTSPPAPKLGWEEDRGRTDAW